MQEVLEAEASVTQMWQHSTTRGHNTLQNICWNTPWNHELAHFESCFLPVISAIPLLVALLIISIHSLALLTSWRLPWTQPFIVEYSKPKLVDVLEIPGRARPRIHLLALTILASIAFALQLAKTVVSWPGIVSLPATATWLLVLTLLLVHRPRAVPVSVLTVLLASTFAHGAIAAQDTGSDKTTQAIHITTFVIAIISVVLTTLMPLRDSALSSKDISRTYTTPTSTLRSPEDNLSLWQWMTVSWMTPLISIGSKLQLEDEDVWQLGLEFQHKRLHEAFRILKGTVISRLIQANGIDLVLLTALGLLETVADYAQPVLLQRLLSSMQDPLIPKSAAVNYAGLALVVRLAATQSGVFSLWFGRRCYERSRGEMITMLYEKTLDRKISFLPAAASEGKTNGRLQENGQDHKSDAKPNVLSKVRTMLSSAFDHKKTVELKQPASMGKILNLMRNDVYEVAQRFWEVQSLVTIPLNIVFSMILVVQFLGPTSLVSIIVIILAQVINAFLARVLIMLEKRRRKATDDKLQIVSQYVESIRHLRWYGWQDAWLQKIMAARQHELNWRIITSACSLLIGLINSLGLELAPAIAFYAYTAVGGGSLTVDIGFPALTLMFMLTSSLRDVPQLITVILNAWVAVGRIEDFMAEPNKDANKDEEGQSEQSNGQLALQNASLAWPGSSQVVLSNVSVAFPQGLTVISGEVAAGKSALLQALLGELDLLQGSIIRPDTAVGYCAQSPWLQSMSIRDNILFSAPYNEQRYKDVLKACALIPDLEELPARDLSFIGENGIGLSGGQKARVALARAAYSESKILLLDDPLSALDQQTAEIIVRELFTGPLFRGRTVVLVTHRLDLVSNIADQLLEIQAGHVERSDKTKVQTDDLNRTISKSSTQDDRTAQQKSDSTAAVVATKFIEDEHRAQGGVKAIVYWEYIKAGKLYLWAILIVMLAAYRLATVFLQWYLKAWGEAYDHVVKGVMFSTLSDDTVTISSSVLDGLLPSKPPDEDVIPWVTIILLIGVTRALLGSLVQVTMIIVTYVAGKKMFKDIMYKVGHATFRFYDVTPVGRLMNRMTSDIGVIDGNISQQFHAIAWLVLAWVSSIVVIAFVTPTFLAFSAVLTVVFILIFRRFLPTSQSLRRLEMVSLTPLMSNFGELLNGLVTVRAFCAQDRFQQRVISVVDNFQKMDHFYWSLQAWLMYRYDTLSAFSTFLLTMLALGTDVSPGLTAFVLLAASKFVKTTHSLCKQYGQLQMEFVSVERVVELLHLDQEPEGKVKAPAWWPSFSGDIEFKDVHIKYAPHLDPALAGVSFTIRGGSKTAILGRTGSGKSTLALAMLATILPESGQILVDNIDLAQVDKQILRTRVTFLAQDPVLFPGTMQQNLDPLEHHSPEECEAVLARVCDRQGWKLTTQIEGGGRNLSQGQRQLVGLARAVLRRSAIIILDEATASIDLETSMQIQQVLHEEMKNSTVITIAHRLEAVSNADYCIVLGKGRIVGQGPAADLLADRDSHVKDNEVDETNDQQR